MAGNVDTNALKLRYCALEQEALAALTPAVTALAYPRWTARPEVFPYFINRVNRVSVEEGVDDYGEEMSVYVYAVVTRLVVAHVTADYAGELDEALDDYLPQVIEYIDARELLQSAAYPTALPSLSRASFTDGTGFMVLPLSPGGIQQVGAEFLWRNEFVKSLTQAYEG